MDCNTSAVKMLGCKNKQDLLATNLSQLFPERHPDGHLSYEKADEMLAIAMQRGFHRFEWDHIKNNGIILPVEVSITAVKEDNKNSLYVVWRDIIEQREAEEEKLETEKKLKAIFNHRFQLTGLLTADGKLVMANQTACTMVGVKSSELEGKYFWELPHWSHSEELQHKVQEAIQSAQKGNVVNFETTHADSKGNVHIIDFSLTPVRNESGEIVFIVPEGQDITARKQSEMKLIEGERNYREIYNSSSDGIFIHDVKTGKIIDVNQTMLEMYGYTYEEALQLEIRDISFGERDYTQEIAYEKVKKVVTEGPQLFVWSAKHKSGTCFWVEVALRKTTIGGKGRVLAVVRDITQRKQLDNELRMVKHSIEHSAYPFEWIQEDSRFLYVNEATCHALGYTHEEMCSMHVADIDPDYSLEVWPGFWERLKAQKTLVFETYHHKKNGEKYPVEITANYVNFEGRGHVFSYTKDISEKRIYEKEQKQFQNQLQQAQKMEAIGTLAGGIAHDFNNILSGIYGYTELAKFSLNDPESLRDYLDQIFNGAKRAKDLVQQILTVSRKSDQELKPLKAQSVVKEALKLLRSSIPSTIEIKDDIDPACEAIFADPTQVHQIVMNLCTNAYHSMRETEGVLGVSLRPIELLDEMMPRQLDLTPGSYLILEIRDSGYGIPRDILGRIFEPYFTTKQKGDGTGLGLAVVHGIVKSFGGDITVASEPGNGTIFHVYLPVAEKIRQEPRKELTPPLQVGTERILFVDDDETIVKVSKKMLETLGYTVIAMISSVNALDTFKKAPNDFDLVITDVTMPGMTGADLGGHILQIRPEIPIILSTGSDELTNAEKVKLIGSHDYLIKPITHADLAKTVRKVLDEKNTP